MAESDPLGIDLDVTTDMDPTFRLCHGARNLGNALLRRLNCDAGGLASIGDDPNYGENVATELLNETSQGDLAVLNARIVAQCNQDERVQNARARVIATEESLVVPLEIETVTGVVFPLVASVGEVSVDRLKAGLPTSQPATQSETVGTTITVVSQTGPAGPAGPQGAAASSSGVTLPVDFDGTFATDSTAEAVLSERLVSFAMLSSATITMSFSALCKALGGATGTWYVRLGGTDGAADGTLLGTLTVTSSSYVVATTSASLTNPLTSTRVKLTGRSSVTGLDTIAKAIVCTFQAG
jgi:hypothetical protein